jgi:phospholipid/cholesterol/gamma-HCH transport system substrate-binding protein
VRTVKLPNLDDVLAQVTDIVGGLQSSIKHVNGILEDPKTRAAFQDVMRNIQLTVQQTAALTGELREMLAENRPELNKAVAGVNSTVQEFATMSRELRIAMETGGFPQIQAALNNVVKVTENLAAASKQLRELSEDKQMQGDIKQAMSSAKQAAEGVAAIVDRVGDVIGAKKTTGPSIIKPSKERYVPEKGLRTDAFLSSDDIDFRVDLNYTLAGADDRFYRLGLYDFGENTRLNLQLGNSIDSRSAFRYGLYASKLGVGYDRILGRDLSFHLDLFRPNDPRLEAKFRYDFSPSIGAWGGVTNVFGDTEALFGVQYRK